ncbi:dienelactone hydrolase family protein [Orenia marismortui]|uniref:dienelactone hydrolase family protein n=1 Tax=Orenia marismortui TaxID=46469 RepID=UPI0003672826|nr:dienelactone hydrolase family protein [Orenia marismortui]
MLTYHNQSDICVLVIHEIYGINQHMQTICEKLSDCRFDVICPNLLQREDCYSYCDEKDAYQNFKENIGFSLATRRVKALLYKIRDKYEIIIVVGFSIGATIAWLCSNDKNLCDIIIGYYGSKIRDYTEILPKSPTILFFPEEEKEFNVLNLIEKIKENTNIKIYKFKAEHGFSDPYSSKYCFKTAKKAEEKMMEFIQDYIDDFIVG